MPPEPVRGQRRVARVPGRPAQVDPRVCGRETVAVSVPSKSCASCGREITWRKKWARDWESVRYCSAACRSRPRTTTDDALEASVLALLAGRAGGATICPSEAARQVDPGGWRALMEPARAAARRLVAAGEIDIVQGGQVIDGSSAKGPIRLRRRTT